MRPSPSAIVLVLSIAAGSIAACTDSSSAPIGVGDTFYMDVEASAASPDQPDRASAPDSPFASVDGSNIYGRDYDAYAVRSICAPVDASSSSKDEGGSKTVTDAESQPDSTAYLAVEGGGGYGGGDAGCEPFPSACTNSPDDCTCLLSAFASEIPCVYPSCGVHLDKSGFSLYCPP